MASAKGKKLSIFLSKPELDLLKKFDFRVLASATLRAAESFQLTGSHLDFESLVGWVAGEANDADRRRAAHEAAMLGRIFEEIDAALNRT